VDKEQRRELFQRLLPKIEEQERDRGLSDEEIAANRRKLTQIIAEEGNRTNPYFGDVEQMVDTGVPPASLTQFRETPIVRLAAHGILVRLLLVGICALLGYYGLPTRSGRIWDPGARGALYGVGFGLGVLVLTEISLRRSRRRRRNR
jgi:hypothetical protein